MFGGVSRQRDSARPPGWPLKSGVIGTRRSTSRVDDAPRGFLPLARYSLQAWSENGADSLSLSAPAQAIRSAQAGAGVYLMRSVGRVRPTVSTTYRRELTDGRTATTIQLLDGAGGLFLVDGLRLAKDTINSSPRVLVPNRPVRPLARGRSSARVTTEPQGRGIRFRI